MTQKELAFDHAPVGLAVLENRIIRQCNVMFARTFGGHPDDFTDTPLAHFYISVEDYRRIGERGLAAMRETGHYSDERVMKRLDGQFFLVSCTRAIPDA